MIKKGGILAVRMSPLIKPVYLLKLISNTIIANATTNTNVWQNIGEGAGGLGELAGPRQ